MIQCGDCGVDTPARSPSQRFCPACSTRRDLERKRLWAREHSPDAPKLAQKAARNRRLRPLVCEAGAQTSVASRRTISWSASDEPELLWLVRVAVPFTYAASKNHIYTLRRAGHVALRREARAKRAEIVLRIRNAIADQRVAHNKLWLDLLVQKPDHRGDAVNVVDLVCDAVQDAIGLDDRWFCIRRLDWEIVKREPHLVIGIGQSSSEDCQICSHCGQAKPFTDFTRRKSSKLGIGRACRECLRAGRKLARRKQEAVA